MYSITPFIDFIINITPSQNPIFNLQKKKKNFKTFIIFGTFKY